VKLNVPRISDGNNFGVEVQEQIMDLLDSTENSGYAVLDGFNVYHLSRAQLVVEVSSWAVIVALIAWPSGVETSRNWRLPQVIERIGWKDIHEDCSHCFWVTKWLYNSVWYYHKEHRDTENTKTW
jgi:hypothetical protein